MNLGVFEYYTQVYIYTFMSFWNLTAVVTIYFHCIERAAQTFS